jgi:hypothetical protein
LGATYTLGLDKDQQGVGNPCDLLNLDAYHARQYSYTGADQRNRAVFNGLWLLPYDVQLSGVYFYGSGLHYAQPVGGDPLQCQCADGRYVGTAAQAAQSGLPIGSFVQRNGFVGQPLHRVDLRVSRRFPLFSAASIEGMLEAFNIFNHSNYGSYLTTVGLASFGQPTANTDLAYAPRMLQLGFRVRWGS